METLDVEVVYNGVSYGVLCLYEEGIKSNSWYVQDDPDVFEIVEIWPEPDSLADEKEIGDLAYEIVKD